MKRASLTQLSMTTDPYLFYILFNRISDLTLAEYSVYKPYIVFFVLIDKFHHLLKVGELNRVYTVILNCIHNMTRACLQTFAIVEFATSCHRYT